MAEASSYEHDEEEAQDRELIKRMLNDPVLRAEVEESKKHLSEKNGGSADDAIARISDLLK